MEDNLDDIPINQNRLNNSIQLFTVEIFSFGFKFGPSGDVVKNFNIRKVENPPNKLRKGRTGLNKELREELFKNPETESIFQGIKKEIIEIIQKELSAEKSDEEIDTIRIGIGCNSGKHRSVAFVERIFKDLAEEFHDAKVDIIINHRDINRK